MRKATVLFGPLEEVMFAGLVPSFRRRFRVLQSPQTGRRLIHEGERLGCCAVVMRRQDLALLTGWPPTMVCVGVASAAADILIVQSGTLTQHPDASPDEVCTLIGGCSDDPRVR